MLVDVHTALDLAALDAAGDTERVFVRGSYEYHHYGQVLCRPASGLCAARCFRDTAGHARKRDFTNDVPYLQARASARRDASVTRLAARESEISQTMSRTCSRMPTGRPQRNSNSHVSLNQTCAQCKRAHNFFPFRTGRASTTTAGDVPTAAARQFFRGVCSPLRASVCAGRIRGLTCTLPFPRAPTALPPPVSGTPCPTPCLSQVQAAIPRARAACSEHRGMLLPSLQRPGLP
jgi:hypothetical protein